MRGGEGKILLTTFNFDEYGADPYATRLLDSMITYTGTRIFAPRLEYPIPAVAATREIRP
jgi:hypothetical protein